MNGGTPAAGSYDAAEGAFGWKLLLFVRGDEAATF
jgi:hypothetical protein